MPLQRLTPAEYNHTVRDLFGATAFRTDGFDADEEDDFWKQAVPLGADPALMRNRSSFVRMPHGMRDNGKRQSVLYLDPSKAP